MFSSPWTLFDTGVIQSWLRGRLRDDMGGSDSDEESVWNVSDASCTLSQIQLRVSSPLFCHGIWTHGMFKKKTAANLTRMMQLVYKEIEMAEYQHNGPSRKNYLHNMNNRSLISYVPVNLAWLGQIWQYRLKWSKAVRNLLEVLEAGLPTSIGSDSFHELEVRTNKLQENCSCLDIWGIDWIEYSPVTGRIL